MDDIDGKPGMPGRGTGGYDAFGFEIDIPPSLEAYLAMRTEDVVAALQTLISERLPTGLWTPVVGRLAALSSIAPCRFDAQLLLRPHDDGLDAIVSAREWSVSLARAEAWIDVVWPSEVMAMSLEGKPVRTQIDFPFLSPLLTVCGSVSIGTYRRFHCLEATSVA